MRNRRRQVVILITGGLVVALLVGRAVGLRMVGYLETLDKEIQAQRELLQQIDAEIRTNQPVVDNWNRIKGFADEPVVERQTNFSGYLQSLQAERDFEYMVMGPPAGRPMEDRPEFQTLKYELSFYADLEDMVEFLAALDRSERLLRIERLKISIRQDYKGLFDLRPAATGRVGQGALAVEMAVVIPAAAPPPPDTEGGPTL